LDVEVFFAGICSFHLPACFSQIVLANGPKIGLCHIRHFMQTLCASDHAHASTDTVEGDTRKDEGKG